MDYEKKYKEALERARANYKADKEMGFLENCDMLELIFPELRESEDERIRKAIIKSIEEDSSVYEQEVSKEQMLTWLEKQKEQKPDPFGDNLSDSIPDDWRTKISTNDSSNAPELKAENVDAVEGCMLRYLQSAANRKDDDEIMEDTRKYKQELYNLINKPAGWSEEDEKTRRNLMSLLVNMRADNRIKEETYQKYYSWLKSLKPQPKEEGCDYITPNKEFFQRIYDRLVYVHKENPDVDYMRSFKKRIDSSVFDQYHWKPSDEQMSMLLAVINDPNNAGSESCHLALISIYEQLKRLI